MEEEEEEEKGREFRILLYIPSAFSLARFSCDMNKHYSIDFIDLL